MWLSPTLLFFFFGGEGNAFSWIACRADCRGSNYWDVEERRGADGDSTGEALQQWIGSWMNRIWRGDKSNGEEGRGIRCVCLCVCVWAIHQLAESSFPLTEEACVWMYALARHPCDTAPRMNPVLTILENVYASEVGLYLQTQLFLFYAVLLWFIFIVSSCDLHVCNLVVSRPTSLINTWQNTAFLNLISSCQKFIQTPSNTHRNTWSPDFLFCM